MELDLFVKQLKRQKGKVFSIIITILALMTIVTFSQPLKYSAKSRLLIAQNLVGSDPYTVSKSNQYLSNLYSQIIFSASFFDLVADSEYIIDLNYFGKDYNQQIKRWHKTISARSIGDTGILEIQVYHPETNQASQIALAINHILITQGPSYHSNNDNIQISVIDRPLLSNFPTKPNIALNLLAALIVGIVFSFTHVYFFPRKTKRIIVKNVDDNNRDLNQDSSKQEDDKSFLAGNINNIFE
jgi:capsular polysaccharide biosynthesis protein